MTSSPHALMPRATRNTMVGTREELARGANLKKPISVGLESATRLHEVGIASNRGSARRGEYVPSRTHRPSHHGSSPAEAVTLTYCREELSAGDDWGEVVTR